MHSHFDSAAATLAYLKSRLENNVPNIESEDSYDSECHEILNRIENLISQCRSAKVVSGKAIRQLEDLKSRSLSLDPSTFTIVEQTEDSTSEFTASVRSFGASLLRSLTAESQDITSAHARIAHALTSNPALLSASFARLQSANSHLQAFYSLTNSLSRTIELPSPPPPPPWELLAQKWRAESADLAAHDMELSRLKDEVSEKNTTVAIKDKIVEELSVKVEVLEKRVGESGGRREKVRELEVAAENAKTREKDLIANFSHLRDELKKIEAERETWKQASRSQPSNDQSGRHSPANEATTSPVSLRQIEYLQVEIAALQSSIRYLRSAQHSSLMSSSEAFLSTPLVTSAPQPSALELEAKDVLKEMLYLVSQPTSVPIKLHPRRREDRLRWRPAKETSTWQIQRQREEWEEWREWRDGVAKRSAHAIKEDQRKKSLKPRVKPITNAQIRLPGKEGDGRGGEVQIARPEEWEPLQQALGDSVS
ncbi:MAG: hypothetical protein Q9163_000319 [Psora crenata]